MTGEYIYINLHPAYDYASVIMRSFVDIREYVKLVDWLSWGMNKREVWIHANRGEDTGGHIKRKRVDAFVQRMEQAGKSVLVRNYRQDKEPWKRYEYDPLPDDDIVKIECERRSESDEMIWAMEDCKKWKLLSEKHDLSDEILRQYENEARERLSRAKEAESQRIKSIENLWK